MDGRQWRCRDGGHHQSITPQRSFNTEMV